jgi:uncharacterized protein
MTLIAHRAARHRALAAAILPVLVLAACGDLNGDATPTPTATVAPSPTNTPDNRLNLAQALPATFTAHSSVEQIYVTDADPGISLMLVTPDGTIVGTKAADDQGTLIFRDLPPGSSYEVAASASGQLVTSPPVAVWGRDDVPPQSFYDQQQIGAGYGYLQTRDGITLAINVILPGPVENGPYPTVLEYSGYAAADPDSPQPSTMIASILGYAAVGVNMRGSGCSGGAFQYFETLQDTDGYDAIEAIAAQPWVQSHKVGMVGISYPGISQLFVAQTQPPHLASIAPLSIISDSARGILYPGGILNDGFAVSWTEDRQHDALPGGQPWSQQRIDAGDQICIDNQRLRGQTPDLLALVYQNQYYDPKVGDPLAPVTFVNRIKVPVFLAGAWQDEQTGGYFPTMLDHFTGTDKLHFTLVNGNHTDSLGPAIFTRWNEFLSFYVRQEIPVLSDNAKLLLEGLAEQVFGVNFVNVEPDRFTGAASFADALARFEAEPKVRVLFENGAAADSQRGAPEPSFEQSFDSWPIPSVQPAIWYFADNGRLDPALPTGDGADSYIYDTSASQRTTITGSDEAVWTALPAWDWRPLAAGKAVAYATDPLSNTMVMIGSGSVDLWLESTATDTDLQVTLTEIRPDGQEYYVQNGWLRASQRKVDPLASSELRPVQTHLIADAADLPPGQFAEARVELYPFGHVFRAGSRIRISVETPGGERPRWEFGVLQPDGPVINTIAHSAAAPSRIVLPLVPGIDVPTPLPPCPALRGQPCRAYEAFTNTAG